MNHLKRISILLVTFAFLLTSAHSTSAGSASHLLISEVFYDTPGADSNEEWIEIYNPTTSAIDISNYKVGDEETKGGSEGMFKFPDGTKIQAGAKMTVALKASGFYALYGRDSDFEISDTKAQVPDMLKYSIWGTGTISLANTGDEVLLLNEGDNAIDVVTYEKGSYPGVTPHPGVPTGHSLERFPPDRDTDDCSADFRDQPNPNPETMAPPPPKVTADFQISADPAPPDFHKVVRGEKASWIINLESMGDFNSPISLKVFGLPSRASATLSHTSVIPPGSSGLEITTSDSSPVGSYLILVMGISGNKVHSCYVNLKVVLPPSPPSDFILSLDPNSDFAQTVVAGDSASWTLNLNRIGDFGSSVRLMVYGLPDGAHATFDANSVTPDGISTLIISTSPSTPHGSYLIPVMGISQGKAHSCYINLKVKPPF
ncbi:MAG: lamin tail domain-containing protein [Actinomycetota bacterium]|nr:lamin tail domain-containing protein [Actinomycetota bacterium]